MPAVSRMPASCRYATNSVATIFTPIRLPTIPASPHDTPMSQTNGARNQPKIFSSVRPSIPITLPSAPTPKLTSASRAMNASSIAPTLSASCIPCEAPAAAASITLTSLRSTSTVTLPPVSGTADSGTRSLEITKAAGAFITLAVRRWPAMSGKYGDSMPTYAAITPPAIVAKPPTITVFNSDFVSRPMNGLIMSGASVMPTKIFPATERVSAPDVRIVRCMIQAMPRTRRCMMPR